jgi:hypothetical protein
MGGSVSLCCTDILAERFASASSSASSITFDANSATQQRHDVQSAFPCVAIADEDVRPVQHHCERTQNPLTLVAPGFKRSAQANDAECDDESSADVDNATSQIAGSMFRVVDMAGICCDGALVPAREAFPTDANDATTKHHVVPLHALTAVESSGRTSEQKRLSYRRASGSDSVVSATTRCVESPQSRRTSGAGLSIHVANQFFATAVPPLHAPPQAMNDHRNVVNDKPRLNVSFQFMDEHNASSLGALGLVSFVAPDSITDDRRRSSLQLLAVGRAASAEASSSLYSVSDGGSKRRTTPRAAHGAVGRNSDQRNASGTCGSDVAALSSIRSACGGFRGSGCGTPTSHASDPHLFPSSCKSTNGTERTSSRSLAESAASSCTANDQAGPLLRMRWTNSLLMDVVQGGERSVSPVSSATSLF